MSGVNFDTFSKCRVTFVGPINKSLCPENYSGIVKIDNEINDNSIETIIEFYVIMFLCFIGITGNILTICVLRCDYEQRHRLLLLQILAVCDTTYLVVTFIRYPFKYILNDSSRYINAELYIYPLHQMFQCITIYMMVLVTCERYICVCHALRAHSLVGGKRRYFLCFGVVIFCVLYCLPQFFASCIMTFEDICTGTSISSIVYTPTFHNVYYYRIYKYGLSIVLFYFIPLCVLFNLSIYMIYVIKSSARWRQETSNRRHVNNAKNGHDDRNATLTLVMIVMVFNVCETPEMIFKIMTLLSQYFSSVSNLFSNTVINQFGAVTEMFTVINSSVNFFIYCAFSKRFMQTFLKMLHGGYCKQSEMLLYDKHVMQEIVGLRTGKGSRNAHPSMPTTASNVVQDMEDKL